jgi:hypothetical protein
MIQQFLIPQLDEDDFLQGGALLLCLGEVCEYLNPER